MLSIDNAVDYAERFRSKKEIDEAHTYL